ncbi:chaperone protein dnaJ [Bacteriophage sp.]|nr:chaperone protein dnaJ [Bacteriophage sp.]
MSVSISVDSPGVYAVRFPYNEEALAAIKTLKTDLRAWEPTTKCWLIQQSAMSTVAGALTKAFNQSIAIPPMTASVATPQIQKRIVKLEYLGQPKDRGNAEPEAYGFANGAWSIVIGRSVLESFFGEQVGDEHQTYYQILCIVESCTPDEIKSAYRRLARQWHPDVCREDGAREKFEQIKEAYQKLSDPMTKKRYDAGLYFERQGRKDAKERVKGLYVAPLRCGELYVQGFMRRGRLVVTKIDKWLDLVNDKGEILVTTWRAGEKDFDRIWVNPGTYNEPF